MCGINGFSFKDEKAIKLMNEALSHRGPDGSSHFADENISLGHARLSIIDLSDAASQPMFYAHKGRKIAIVFNGEIYNYIEVKKRLADIGYSFLTASDTEVIMAAYLEWGEQLVNELNGMWAFCIYDLDKHILFCSRDRLGVKPLYYYSQNEKFIFSSELKAILKHEYLGINSIENINNDAVELYFSMGFIPAPHSIYKNVFKLGSGSNLVYDLRNKQIEKNYCWYQFPVRNKKDNRASLIEEGKELLKDAVKLRMRSDVPVGAFLSGGLDSSSVVGEMKYFTDLTKLHTFSIGFEEKKYDESYYIHLVKDYFHTAHHHHIYKESDFKQTWPVYANVFDEPFGDYSSFPSHTVCGMARKEVTVVLSGDGGDEIFGGYPIYNTGYIMERVRKLPVFSRELFLKAIRGIRKDSTIGKIGEVIRISLSEKKDFYSELFADSRYKPEVYRQWTSDKLNQALKLSDNNLSEALRIFDLLSNTLPDNFLVKVDRTSMANSVEVRSPFLDYRFVEFAERIPAELKVGVKDNKILMREIIKNIVPDEILKRNKMGFTPPIHTWLDQSISHEDFVKYNSYINKLSPALHQFYTRLLAQEKKDYMVDLYKIKLAIFGRWFDKWILSQS